MNINKVTMNYVSGARLGLITAISTSELAPIHVGL
jgi:hypothetical protein